MADSIYTKLLRQAAEIEGSTQALATRLRVPGETLMRWMSGRAFMPYLAFLEALDYVAAREHGLSQDTVAAGGELSFSLARNFAHCSMCDGVKFRGADLGEPLRYVSKLTCLGCGTEVRYGELVVALAKEATSNARASFVRLKRTQAELRASDPRKK